MIFFLIRTTTTYTVRFFLPGKKKKWRAVFEVVVLDSIKIKMDVKKKLDVKKNGGLFWENFPF